MARGTCKSFRLSICALLAVTALCALSFAPRAHAAQAGEGTVDSGGARYAFTVADGEATITRIGKAPGNGEDTYEAIIPAKVPYQGREYLVTRIGKEAAGGRLLNPTPATTSFECNDEITRISIPAKVVEIEDCAFAGCRKAAEIVFREEPDEPDGEPVSHLERLGDHAFAACESVGEWLLPDSLLHVGYRAFQFGAGNSAKKVKFPASSASYDDMYVNAFSPLYECEQVIVPEGCEKLPSIMVNKVRRLELPSTLRGKVHVISSGTSQLEEVTLSEGAEIAAMTLYVGAVESFPVPEGVRKIELKGDFMNVSLPESLQELERISAPKMTSLAIPAGVAKIDSYAFMGSPELKSIRFESGSRLRMVDSNAFNGCKALESLELPEGVLTIGGYPFRGCDALVEAVIPASVVSHGCLFKECANLKRVSYARGSGMRELRTIAEDCPSLEEVSLPDSGYPGSYELTASETHILENCPSIKRVFAHDVRTVLTEERMAGCGTGFEVYGWGVDGPLVASVEVMGATYVPYAELDGSAKTGSSNVTVQVREGDMVQATCAFGAPTTFDYSRTLTAGDAGSGADFAVQAVERNGLRYLRLTGNGLTCFGQVDVPALQDVSGASVSTIGVQVIASGEVARPRPVVTMGGDKLVVGRDFELAYHNNDRAGTATVKVSGIGNYRGSCEAAFTVVERNVLSAGKPALAARLAAALSAARMSMQPAKCDAVVVAWAHDGAGLAVGATLAAAKGAQLLAVSKGGLAGEQRDAVRGWAPTRAYLVGGAARCGASTRDDLEGLGLSCVEVGGETPNGDDARLSVDVARICSGDGTTAVVANPEDPAVLLAAASFSSMGGVPCS